MEFKRVLFRFLEVRGTRRGRIEVKDRRRFQTKLPGVPLHLGTVGPFCFDQRGRLANPASTNGLCKNHLPKSDALLNAYCSSSPGVFDSFIGLVPVLERSRLWPLGGI